MSERGRRLNDRQVDGLHWLIIIVDTRNAISVIKDKTSRKYCAAFWLHDRVCGDVLSAHVQDKCHVLNWTEGWKRLKSSLNDCFVS